MEVAWRILITWLVLTSLGCKKTVVDGVTNVSIAYNDESKVDDDIKPEKRSKARRYKNNQAIIPHQGGRCLAKPADVRVVFLLDASEGMQSAINIVKTQIAAMSKLIAAIDFGDKALRVASVDFAVIIFRDLANSLQRIRFGQMQQLPSLLNEIQVFSPSGDPEDDGLKALLLALKTLAELPQNPAHDFLPLIVAVTDDFSHNGVVLASENQPGVHDCTVSWPPLVEQLAAPIFDHLMIYDATPQIDARRPDTKKCIGYVGTALPPSRQWEDVRKLWRRAKGDRRATAVGRGLNFPFTEFELINVLTRDLEASFTACEQG